MSKVTPEYVTSRLKKLGSFKRRYLIFKTGREVKKRKFGIIKYILDTTQFTEEFQNKLTGLRS